jgi:DnaJ-like protein
VGEDPSAPLTIPAAMLFVDLIAESKIAEAARAGAFDKLPGAGKPLDLDFDRMIPEDVRIAYRILRNSGFVPPELEARREAANLRNLLAVVADEDERGRAAAKLALIETALESRGHGRLGHGEAYRRRILARLQR